MKNHKNFNFEKLRKENEILRKKYQVVIANSRCDDFLKQQTIILEQENAELKELVIIIKKKINF